MSSPHPTVGLAADLDDRLAEITTLAMNDTLDTYRKMTSPIASAPPEIYLRRATELQRITLGSFGAAPQPRWLLGSMLPLMLSAGGIEIVAITHAGWTTSPLWREASFLQVFTAEREESWHAGIHRRADRPPRLGAWRPGADGALDERTRAAITNALCERAPGPALVQVPRRR